MTTVRGRLIGQCRERFLVARVVGCDLGRMGTPAAVHGMDSGKAGSISAQTFHFGNMQNLNEGGGMLVTIYSPPRTRLAPVAAWIIVFSAMLAVLGCGDQKQQADQLVRAAMTHTKADRQVDAVQSLGRAIALDPSLAEAFYLRGACFTKMQQPQKAMEDLSAATRLKPNWDEAWCALGIAQITSHEAALGVASLSKALQLNSQLQPALEARARGYRELHRTEDEFRDIEELLKLNATHSEALLRRGTLLSGSNSAQAIEDLSNVIRRDRSNSLAWMQRGLCYHRSGDSDRAMADLNIACRLRANDFHPWLERGRILRILKRSDDAISDLSKAAELAPNDFATRLELGRSYLESANLAAAVANLLEAERLSPRDGDLRIAFAQAELVQGNKAAALERLQSLLADEQSLVSSQATAIRISLAELLLESNNIDEAMSHVEQVLELTPTHTDALQIRVALLVKSNRREEAIEDYTQLISSSAALQPDAVTQYFLERGRLHLEGHAWSAAAEDLSKYLAVYPDDVDTLTLRAQAFLAQHDAGHAITDLTLAILHKPTAELYALRGDAFEQFHEPTAALADLQKAISLKSDDQALHQKLAERLFQDRQFAKSAMTLDLLAALNAGKLSATQHLLRGRAHLADGNLGGADEDACALAAEASDSVTQADVILLQAMIALGRHDDLEALRLVKNMPEETLPPDALLMYGQTLARQNHTDEAIRIFSNLLNSDPFNTAALLARATVSNNTSDWQAATADASAVLRVIPDDPRALQIKSNSLFQNERFSEALETLDHPALLSRDTNDSRWMRIQCCTELKLTFRELEELNALLGIEPTHHAARMLRAGLLETMGRFDDAIADLSVVLQQNPATLAVITRRGLLNQRLGNALAADVDFTKAIELSPHDGELYYRRGIARHQLGKSDDALHDLEKTIELNSHLADAWYVIGNLEAGRGQLEVAMAAYAKAVEIKPGHAAAWYNRGNLLFNQSKLHQAVDCWTIAITLQPDLFRAYNNRAAAYDRMGQDTEAVADYEKTLELNPNFMRAWDNLAWLLATSANVKVRDPQRAVKLATQACELSEFKDWACLNTLAGCCAENQEFDAAVKWAKQTRAIAPEANHQELDQLVAAYEASLTAIRVTGKPHEGVR